MSLDPSLQLIPKYNGVVNEVRDWSLLTTNVCSLELGDNTDELVIRVHIESSNEDFNDNDNAFGMEKH